MVDDCTVGRLSQRVERLERENFWLKALCIAPLLGLSAVLLLGATHAEKQEVKDKIQAKKFVVVDKDNNKRAILGIDDKWGVVSLSFYAKNPPDEEYLEEPVASLQLMVKAEGNPSLAFHDKDGKSRAWLYTDNDGGSIFCIGVDCAGGGKAVVNIFAHPNGTSLAIYDANKAPRAILGRSSLEATGTGVTENRPESSLVFFDKKGKTIWKAP